MNDREYNALRETARRRPLCDAEEAQLEALLADDPDKRRDWAEEQALNHALRALPDAPVSSNFTARVLQAVERERRAPVRRRPVILTWLGGLNWVQRGAIAAAFVAAAMLTWKLQRSAHHAELARNAATLTTVTPVPSIEVLEDFDTILRLGTVPPGVDMELLAANP